MYTYITIDVNIAWDRYLDTNTNMAVNIGSQVYTFPYRFFSKTAQNQPRGFMHRLFNPSSLQKCTSIIFLIGSLTKLLKPRAKA